MGKTIVRTEGLTKDYGRRRGIVDLDLEIAWGEVFGDLGPTAPARPDGPPFAVRLGLGREASAAEGGLP
jgi:ABC-type lipopolysaccharide export system ATPase subunit